MHLLCTSHAGITFSYFKNTCMCLKFHLYKHLYVSCICLEIHSFDPQDTECLLVIVWMCTVPLTLSLSLEGSNGPSGIVAENSTPGVSVHRVSGYSTQSSSSSSMDESSRTARQVGHSP